MRIGALLYRCDFKKRRYGYSSVSTYCGMYGYTANLAAISLSLCNVEGSVLAFLDCASDASHRISRRYRLAGNESQNTVL